MNFHISALVPLDWNTAFITLEMNFTSWPTKTVDGYGKLMKTPETQTEMDHWEELIGHREDIATGKRSIFSKIIWWSAWRSELNKNSGHALGRLGRLLLPFRQWDLHTAYTSKRSMYSPILRYSYNSLWPPSLSVIDFHMDTRQKKSRKKRRCWEENLIRIITNPNGFWATAEDGKKIPISMVYRKGVKQNGRTRIALWLWLVWRHHRSLLFHHLIVVVGPRFYICDCPREAANIWVGPGTRMVNCCIRRTPLPIL